MIPPRETRIEIILLVIAVAIAAAGGWTVLSFASGVKSQTSAAEEAAKPVALRLVLLTTPDCKDCVDLKKLVGSLKSQPVRLTEEREVAADSEEGKQLIKEFGLEKVPTFIARGDTTNKKLASYVAANGKLVNDAFVFTNVPPVFLDPASGQTRGNLSAIVLYDKKQCPQCADPTPLLQQFQTAGIRIASVKNVDPQSAEGRSTIETYRLTAVPTILVSGETALYPILKNTPFGSLEADGTFVIRDVQPPYVDMKTNRVVGLVSLISLTDKSCQDCYDVARHKAILTQTFGVKLVSEQTMDVSSASGRSLVKKYSITAVPTVLVSPAAGDYSDLKNAWPSAGTVEKDGWYVFRQMQALGPNVYKDLSKNEVIRPESAATGTATGAASGADDMSGHHP